MNITLIQGYIALGILLVAWPVWVMAPDETTTEGRIHLAIAALILVAVWPAALVYAVWQMVRH